MTNSNKPKSFAAMNSASLVEKAQELARLTEIVRQYLPENLRSHCVVANYRNNILILQVDNPMWGTELRFAIPALKAELEKLPIFVNLKSIQFAVRPGIHEANIKRDRVNPISKNSVDVLAKAASQIDDEGLKNALGKLAKNAREKL